MQIRLIRRLIAVAAACLIMLQFVSLLATGTLWGQQQAALAIAPGNDAFQRTWARTDQPVAQGLVDRTWMWAPEPFTSVIEEEYADTPGGVRLVQYFDKSRMEITDPAKDPADPWYVTNGLLVNELVSGAMQVGHDLFVEGEPAQVNVAGDSDDPESPTYATFGPLRTRPPLPDGAVISQRLDRDGAIENDPAMAQHGVTAAQRVTVPKLDHQVASVFLAFMRSTGAVNVDGQTITERLFESDFYATGLPITEAYWTTVALKG
ncbi:MAG: thermonuclease family protein, partial [Vicinamibacterales bacterium]